MTTRLRALRVVAILGAIGVAAMAVGCELIVDFDRSLIDAGSTVDGSFTDAPPYNDVVLNDSPVDQGADNNNGDAGTDAADSGGGGDVVVDTGSDSADGSGGDASDGAADSSDGASDS